MRITGAKVFDIDRFTERDLCIENGRVVSDTSIQNCPSIAKKRRDTPVPILHADGLYAIPGLVDLHFHGAAGCDFCDGTVEAIEKIAAYEAAHGITTICPATMTYPKEKLLEIMRAVREYREKILSETWPGPDQSLLAGIHLEGPFINAEKIGAQNPSYITEADLNMIQYLQQESGNLLRLITLAPECGKNQHFIHRVKEEYPEIHISIGHTNCDYGTAMKAFENGADHLTHLFNAMPGLHHRNPGPIAAGLEMGAYAEIIADGIHVHPAMVRQAFQMFGPERMILISDSMRACGLADGIYDLGGQSVKVEGRKAVLADTPDTIAGSVTNLFECMKIAVTEMHIPLLDAVRAATYNPARSIGLDGEVGSFLPGRKGVVLLVNEKLDIVNLII